MSTITAVKTFIVQAPSQGRL